MRKRRRNQPSKNVKLTWRRRMTIKITQEMRILKIQMRK
jgi:hypothetical protein